ncbi:GumC family protein [Flavobacterium restrictum]|uniref:non-specific protein-tyrosine kinase n=1 Tax=Flavobacterium restrictum TaxID=2594428 RepID=A0A553DWH7_9FLAO|nr:tyrosine-protein kinase family protein [Flavobacterium restrictum]TRX37052.1 polysaccharide biosynthesis tyrosine autokinase [Flavobacterium restrictum]
MESKENNFNIKQEILKYLSYWKWIVLSITIALLASFFYLRYANNIYHTAAQIKILDNQDAAFKLPSDNMSIFGRDEINLQNEMVIMKSSRIIGTVVDSLNLTTEIYAVGNIKSIEMWKNAPFRVVWATEKDSLATKQTAFQIQLTANGYQIKGENKEYKFGETNFETAVPCKIILKNAKALHNKKGSTYLISLKTRKSAIQAISNSITIDYVAKQSDILSLSLNGLNQEKINAVVNTLIAVFNQDGIEDRQLVSKKTIEFVDERFKFLFNDLDSIETSKANYKKEKEISYVAADAGVLMQNNYDSKSKLETANTQIALSKLMMNAVNATKSFELLPANIGIENGEVNGLIASYNEEVLKRNKLLTSGGGESNPLVKETSNGALQIKNNIKTSLLGYQNVLQLNRDEANRITNTDKEKYSKVPFNEKGVHAIERQQSIKESLYILLLQKREEAAINLAIINPSIKVVDYANFSELPIAPERKIIFITALLIGLLLPIVAIYVFYLFDNKINTKDDLERLIPEIPVVAEIPFIENENKTIQFLDRSILSESFRILRTNINYISPITSKGAVLFVTSTIKGEGKTFVSLNLAITLSTLGKKVILIGADLRNPQLHKKLDIERPNLRGVSNYLYDKNTRIDDIRMNYSTETNLNFDIIFSGTIPPNPAELLSNGRFEMLLNEIKTDYDYIIVDTAPTLLVADTTLITHLADTVLYVTRANYTEKKLLKFIATLKNLNAIKNMGLILNNVGQNKGYGYSYSYNYGYGYGYDNDAIKNTTLGFKIKKQYRKLFQKS